MDHCRKTGRARGLHRKTREEIGKGNQMTALRFQTGGDIRLPSLLGMQKRRGEECEQEWLTERERVFQVTVAMY